MSTSGTTNWNLDVASIIETAARRAFPDANKGTLSAVDAVNARNCINMVLTDITNQGYALSNLEYLTLSLTQGTRKYTLPENVLDIFDVAYAKYDAEIGFLETAMTQIDLAAYNRINEKDIQAYISQYMIRRELGQVDIYVYPVCTNDVDELHYWAFTRTEDASKSDQDVDLPYRYANTLVAGLAYYLALEKPQDTETYEPRLARLAKNYSDALESAFGEDRDRASAFFYPSMRRY